MNVDTQSQRRDGMSALQSFGVVAACAVAIWLLLAILPSS
jgi:hypothetical protein